MTRRSGLTAAVTLVLLAIAVNTFFGVTAYDRTGAKANANCREIEVVKTGLRATLAEARFFVQSSPVRSRAEKAQSLKFYDDALARLAPRKC
jgi:hypothetical protein